MPVPSGMQMMLKSFGLDKMVESLHEPIKQALAEFAEVKETQKRIEQKLDLVLQSRSEETIG